MKEAATPVKCVKNFQRIFIYWDKLQGKAVNPYT